MSDARLVGELIVREIKDFVAASIKALGIDELRAKMIGREDVKSDLDALRKSWEESFANGEIGRMLILHDSFKIAQDETIKAAVKDAIAKDGRSVTLDDVRPMIEAAVAAMPKPHDGKDAEIDEARLKALIEAKVNDAVASIPRASDGKSVTLEDVMPMIDAAVAAIPKPKDGDPGKDADPDAVRKMVSDAVLVLPKPNDGADGKSVTVDDVRPLFDAACAKWALDFERRAQDVFSAAIERMPKAKDGLGFDDLSFEYDGERSLTLKFQRGEQSKVFSVKLPVVIDRGVFKEDAVYERSDGATYGGSWWIAQKDAPKGKPGTSEDWRLAVKKGRDGKDAEQPRPPIGPVRL